MKRILYVSDAKSIHTRRWAEHYRDQGVDVHIASFNDEKIPGVTVHVLPTFGFGRVGYFFAIPVLRTLVRQIRPDVVHAQFVTSYGFLAAFARLHPLVLTAWGSDVLIFPQESRLIHWFASYAVKHADVVTTVAQHMNRAVAELGISEDAVSAVPFGVDVLRFVPPVVPRPENGPLRLICTRNFDPYYNISTLITALQRAAHLGLRLQVDIVGDGPLRGELEAQAESAGIAPWVTFHGHVNHTRLVQLLAQAHVFVTPALSDGNNVSLNEAMACECFPIGTDIPANAQWIENGINGLLYPPGNADALTDCILRAAADAAWRTHAGKLNREIVEQRADWRVCVSHMNDTYARAIASAGAEA